MKSSYFFLALVFLLFPYAAWSQKDTAIERLGSGEINWKDGMITATGIGVAPPTMPAIQARAMAKRAAISVGLRNLLETLKGVAIDSESTVDSYILRDDIIKAQVSGIIQGAKILKIRTEADGSVEILMGLSLRGKLSNTFIPPTFGKISPVSFSEEPNDPPDFTSPAPPSPSTPSPPNVPLDTPRSIQETDPKALLPEHSSIPLPAPFPEVSEESFTTGLIIDATGLGLRPALVPRVFDEDGNELYASQIVQRHIAVTQGIVGYSKDLVAASRQKRVTNKPLIIKGLQAVGPQKTDIIVSRGDVQKLQEADRRSSFLQQARVVIVYD